jgi:hypothetical protein
LRFRLLVIRFRLFRFLLAAAHQRIQKLPPVIHDAAQPVALLIMLALWNTAVRRATSNSARAEKPVNVRRSNGLFHGASAIAGTTPPA